MEYEVTKRRAGLFIAALVLSLAFATYLTYDAVKATPNMEDVDKNTTVLTEELRQLYYNEDKQVCMREPVNKSMSQACNVPGGNSS